MKTRLIILAFITAFFASSVSFAQQLRDVALCPFQETVVIKDAPAKTRILKLTADALSAKQQGASQFIIYSDRQPCPNGTVTARVGYDDKNYVDITFHDGPWMYMEIKSVTSPKDSKIKFTKWYPDYSKHFYEISFMSTDARE